MTARIRIYLVRHGHVQYFDENQQPINPKYAPLSMQGIQQIELLATLLKQVAMDQIFSSSMPRSIQTAEILAKPQANSSIRRFDEIREIKSGRLKDIPPEQAEIMIKNAYYFQTYALDSFMQGERWQDFEQRVTDWLEQMLMEQQGLGHQHVLISAHDAVNRIILNWLHGLQSQDIQLQEQNYGCLNIIDFFIENSQITQTRILLQNFTVHNILKINETHNALDEVYRIYVNSNGFRGE